MLKDKLLHDKLGIPQQTLQKWKNSDTYTRLLYLYLVNQDRERFEQESKKIVDFYNYALLTPKEFSKIVEDNWDRFDIFEGYEPPSTTTFPYDEKEEMMAAALSKDGKSLLLIRYAYTMSKTGDFVINEVEKIVEAIKETDSNISSIKILYISSTRKTPKYFDEIEHDISMVNYSELYKEVSDKHLLIV